MSHCRRWLFVDTENLCSERDESAIDFDPLAQGDEPA